MTLAVWQSASIASSSDSLLAADAEIRSQPELSHALSLLVSHRGEVVFERYYREAAPDDLQHVHSVTKSVVAALIGILVADGLLSLDARVASLVPAPVFESDPAKAAITVEHLMTMTSGLDPRGPWDIDRVTGRGEPAVEGALRAPLIAAPGEFFVYNNGATHVLSAVVEAVTGRPMAELAAERLFAPLGIDRWHWTTDPEGRDRAYDGLHLSPRDLLELGLLHLGGGRWNGAEILDAAYVRRATSAVNTGGRPEQCSYGLLWWVADRAASPVYFAAGHGGQYLLVAPELELVIVTTTDADAVARPLGLPLRSVLTETIVPAFSAPGSTGTST